MPNILNPLPPETEQLLAKLNPIQLAWLSGYAWAKAQGAGIESAVGFEQVLNAPAAEPLKVTVLSASQTGNAESVANALADRLNAEGVNVNRIPLKDYKAKILPMKN